MSTNKPFVLSIAGFDPSAGAGVLADIKTMEQCGVYGFGVNSANTFQNENEFDGVEWVSFESIQKQLVPLFRKYNIQVVKIGLIENLEILLKVCAFLKAQNATIKIIWDPILSASAGFSFHSNIQQRQLDEVLQLVYLITPNQPEYAQLGSLKGVNVLLKGGHAEKKDDVLVVQSGEEKIIKGSETVLKPKHGSGCVLSSAIASYLAFGFSLEDACKQAKRYVETLLASNEGLLGFHKN